MSVTHLVGNQFVIDIRGHKVLVDQVHRDGVEVGPTPTELFVASLAACVGHYAEQFLRRQDLPTDGLRVDCDWAMVAATPPRVGRIGLSVTPTAELPAELAGPLQEAIAHCTVHNSLHQPPRVTVTLASELASAGEPATRRG